MKKSQFLISCGVFWMSQAYAEPIAPSDLYSAQSGTKLESDDKPPVKPWIPPVSKLPKAVIDEAAFLLQHGMGDPRDGEYRSAYVILGSLSSIAGRPTEIHGWALPATKNHQKLVVGLNGLVYPALSVGAKQSLDRDLAQLNRSPHVVNSRRRRAMPSLLIDAQTRGILMIAGRADLAERYGDRLRSNYLMDEFLSRWFDQAVIAHELGDDATAYRVGCDIQRERPAFEKHFIETSTNRTSASGNVRFVFSYLDVLPSLLIDSKRRLDKGPRPPLNLEKVKSLPVSVQVATLVDHLDDVAARQWIQPGDVDLMDDPILAQLVEIGVPAGEALLDTMEHDERLTRSVSFFRNFAPPRNLLTVKQAAVAGFQAILETSQLPRTPDHHLSISLLRKFWGVNKGKSAPQRWFETLQDDQAGWRQWADAETRLFDRVGVRRTGTVLIPRQLGGLKAEVFRDRSNPSLADLLERRARQITFQNDEKLPPRQIIGAALRMGIHLEEWERGRGTQLLRDLAKETLTQLSDEQVDSDTLIRSLVPSLTARHDAGDATAWIDYVAAVSKLKSAPSFDSRFLVPIASHPDDAELAPIRRMLLTPNSAINLVKRLVDSPSIAGFDHLLISPILKLPEVRAAALSALDDRTVIGTSWVTKDRVGWLDVKSGKAQTQGIWPGLNDRVPPADTPVLLRSGDAIAMALTTLNGAPKFQAFWSLKDKDTAIKKLKAFVLAHDTDIEAIIPRQNSWKASPY